MWSSRSPRAAARRGRIPGWSASASPSTAAAIASSASSARPRLVCSTVPVRLKTRRCDGSTRPASRASHQRAQAAWSATSSAATPGLGPGPQGLDHQRPAGVRDQRRQRRPARHRSMEGGRRDGSWRSAGSARDTGRFPKTGRPPGRGRMAHWPAAATPIDQDKADGRQSDHRSNWIDDQPSWSLAAERWSSWHPFEKPCRDFARWQRPCESARALRGARDPSRAVRRPYRRCTYRWCPGRHWYQLFARRRPAGSGLLLQAPRLARAGRRCGRPSCGCRGSRPCRRASSGCGRRRSCPSRWRRCRPGRRSPARARAASAGRPPSCGRASP